MSTDMTFPILRFAALQNIAQLKAEYDRDPELFRSGTCPYDEETIAVLVKLFAPTIVTETIEKKVIVNENGGKRGPKEGAGLTGEDLDEVNAELVDMLKQLRQMGEGEAKLDTGERLQIIKTKASLIEQLIKARERVLNVKHLANFQAVVISILDDLVDEDAREVFLKRLEPYRD